MRIILFFGFVCISLVSTFSQNVKKTFKLNNRYSDVHSHVDVNDNLSLLFLRGKRGEFKVFNNRFEIVAGRNFVIPKFDNKAEFLDLVNEKNGLKFFYINPRKKTITSIYLEKSMNSEPYQNNAMVLESNEHFVAAFNHHERFHVLSHLINTDILRLSVFLPTGEIEKIDLATGLKNLSKLLNKETYEFDFKFAHYGVENMNRININPFLKSTSEKKLFTYGKKLVITIDDPGKTTLIEVNLVTAQVKSKEYHFHLDKCSDDNIVSGISNFHNGFLMRLTYCKDQLNYSIIETDSSILRRNFNVYKDEPIEFKNTVVTQTIDHDGYRETETYVVENSSKFLRTLDDLKLSIHTTKMSVDQLHVKIGGVRQSIGSVYSSTGNRGGTGLPLGLSMGMGMGIGGGGFGMGPGIGMSPFGSPFATSQNYLKVNTCSFVSLVSFPDFEHLEGSAGLTLAEKAVKFSQSKGNFSDILGIFEGNENKIIYGYLSGKDDLYNIIEFTR
ncbi:MAG: hypothetical protein SNJ77_03815 [Cytophagales bacterium]